MTKGDIVYLVDGDHTDLFFKVIENCIKFDDEKQELGLFIVIKPLDLAKFIERFNCSDLKDIDLNDIQIIVKPDEVNECDGVTCIDRYSIAKKNYQY